MPKPLVDLLEIYDLIRAKVCKEQGWIDDDFRPFFLDASGKFFDRLDCRQLSDDIGCDIRSKAFRYWDFSVCSPFFLYFRKRAATWAISHPCKEIRVAESTTLAHDERVAKAYYQQNKVANLIIFFFLV